MQIALIGYGKMGRLIEVKAKEKGFNIVSIVDPKYFKNQIDKKTIERADVCIDFSSPGCILDNMKSALQCGKNLVVGTTGWDEHMPQVKNWVQEEEGGLIYAPNFSLGVQIFIKLTAQAATYLKDYDIAGLEIHHKQKLDAPSGTAIALKKAITNRDVPFSSVRVGSITGTHQIIFDSEVDDITLTHSAKTRDGYALGALKAAEWIKDKKGFFTIDDMMEEIF